MITTRIKPASGRLRFFSAIAIGLTISVASLAEENHDSANDAHEQGFHKNVIGGFIGVTGEDNRSGGGRDQALTLGLEYERRFSEAFGVLVGVERALGDLDFTVITVPLVYHLGEGAVSAGPGIEFTDEGGEEFVFRVAGTYDFFRGAYELTTKVGMDFVAGEVVIFGGLSIAFGF